MVKRVVFLGALFALLPEIEGAIASEKSSLESLKANCKYKQEASLTIDINDAAPSLSETKKGFDNTLQKVKSILKEAGADDVVMTQMRYQISPPRQRDRMQYYNIQGSIGLSSPNEGRAMSLMETLDRQGMRVSMSSNTRKTRDCSE